MTTPQPVTDITAADPRDGREIPFPGMPSTIPAGVVAVPYRYVLLTFGEDDDALLFRLWLTEQGWGDFAGWLALGNGVDRREGGTDA